MGTKPAYTETRCGFEATMCIARAMMGQGVALHPANNREDAVNVAPVVVTPTRVEQSRIDLPMSIDVFDKEEIQTAKPQVLLSDFVTKAPGVAAANNRQNYARDVQIWTGVA